MRIYVASSWRCARQPEVVARLRADGHDAYDFRAPAPGEQGFAWSDIDPSWRTWTGEQLAAALEHPIATHGLGFDLAAMQMAEAFVLVLPCGRSAHLEFGWGLGHAKLGVVLLDPAGQEPELMYGLADMVTPDLERAAAFLRGWSRRAPSGL